MGLEFELCSQGCHDSVILVLCYGAWRVQLHSGQPQIIQTIITEKWAPAWTVAKSEKIVEIILSRYKCLRQRLKEPIQEVWKDHIVYLCYVKQQSGRARKKSFVKPSRVSTPSPSLLLQY